MTNAAAKKNALKIANELRTRIAAGDLRGYTVDQLEAAELHYRNLAG